MIKPASRTIPKKFRLEQAKSLPVVVNFQGGQVTSDAGSKLNIAEIDRRLQIKLISTSSENPRLRLCAVLAQYPMYNELTSIDSATSSFWEIP